MLLALYADMAQPLRNRMDEAGRPICPVCSRSIKMTEIVLRADEHLIHFGCREETRKHAEPSLQPRGVDPSVPGASKPS